MGNRIQAFAFKCNLHRYNPGAVMEELKKSRVSELGNAVQGGGRKLAQDDAAAGAGADTAAECDTDANGACIPASARHPFDHIQYGVSSLLSGQSSATGDPRAGAYYFPAYEVGLCTLESS